MRHSICKAKMTRFWGPESGTEKEMVEIAIMRRTLRLAFLLLLLSGCGGKQQARLQEEKGVPRMELTSTGFREGSAIPEQYTADGTDISPPLRWSGTPGPTQSFALICDDPDAPRQEPWVHWVLFNLPADAHELPEGVPPDETLSNGAKQGKNDFRKIGYGGPDPPRGKPHRYFFKLYALDTMLDLKAGATKQQLEQAIKGHILASGQLMGKYGR
jgi:Raf kinase inhibitor-like YbhB/YbcL family protein